ncbi:hypothetical protein [Pseudomonas anguilliseptica]|uniref:hypothetical protein n=1 Tax=Pseudomonas anguilliseptica TaxID=53406 RepID=UPI0022AF636B|nr:hypothetical protein [Pseudomonas anguilliseptica]MCZ4321458.1 hypothetical protein [Pseudomonas anguilliseptica]
MTRKRALELATMAVVVIVFGAIQFNLGMRHVEQVAPTVLELSVCDMGLEAPSTTELQPL